ncbi:MAG TPA: hypothetical protein VFY93_00325 [Planctomycetota bacterium]|nr:hypothetical protein [Planctomycetota bacterium]
MAERSRDGKGFLLVEDHCPICAAATACRGLCARRLDLFRTVAARAWSGPHVLLCARRCTYRISPGGQLRTPESAPRRRK